MHETPNGNILAMCDEELIDKVIKEGTVIINIKDYSEFYKGELIGEMELDNRYKQDIFSANIVGRKSVDLAVSNRIINKEHVKIVDGIPYAHAYRVDK
jgi:hypothetical protein